MSGSDKLFQPEPLPNEVIDAISDLSNEQKAKWKDHVLPKAAEPISSFVRELEKHRIERHRGPILQAIVNLPIDELADVAQSLVNLNSFQKRMSLVPQTVGVLAALQFFTPFHILSWLAAPFGYRIG